MGKGRRWTSALKSKVTPTGRWAPPPNGHAKCVGMELAGKNGGGSAGVHKRFTDASKSCKGK
ncbi:MAG: hypothetical protein Q7R34_01480 [Dehalococcoidia bacterium]|nr:hypothetical protein [Dehalococcoidia bacterium]